MSTVDVVFVLGQSNGAGLFINGLDQDSGATVLAHDLSELLAASGTAPVAGSELRAVMQATGTTNRFETNNNVVVQNFAEGASSVDGNASGAPPPEQIWWYPATNTPGYLVLAAVDGIMETVNALRTHYDDVRVNIVWSQGENEAKRIVDGRSTAEIYKEATLEVFDYLRTHIDATFPIYIDEIGSSEFVGSEDRWNAGHPIIRAVQQQIAAEHDDIFIGAVSEDLPLQDRVHITDDSYEIVGARLANYIGYTDGLTDTITGPRPTPDPDQIVDPTDTAPQTVGEAFAVQAGAVDPTVAGNLLLNDTDVDGDVLVVGQVIGSNGSSAVYGNAINVLGTYGHLVIDRTGGFTYVVDDNAATRSIAEGATATETFTYIVSDGRGGRTPATLSIEVTGRNDAPVANDDVATAAKTDTNPLAGNVIVNQLGADHDPDSTDTPFVVGISAGNVSAAVTAAGTTLVGAYGSILIHADGSYTYTINQSNPAVSALVAGSTLSDTFVYSISDGHGGSDQATLNIVIQTYPSDVATYGTPTLSGTAAADNLRGGTGDDIIAGFEGNDQLTGNAGNDVLIGGDGDDILFGNDGNDTLVGGQGTDTLKGGAGNDVFVLNSLLDGPDVIQDFRTGDSINLSGVFDLPPGYSAIDAFLFGYLSLTQVGADVRVSVDLDGTAGSLSAVPIATLTGVSLSSIQTYQFVVADPGTLPDDPGRAVATNDTFTVTEASGAALRGNVMHGANPDHDLQGSELAVVAVNGNMGAVGTFVTLPSGAKVKINADGSIYFDTAGKFEWLPAGGTTSVSFNYTITDFFSTSATGTVTVNITGSNDKPVVASPLSATLQDTAQPLAINLLSGASDIDLGAVLSVTNVTGLGNGMTLNGSTLTVDPSAYRHLAVGEQQQFTVGYRVTDENGAFAAQTLSLTLTGTNDAPTVAAALHAETQEDTGILSLNLLTGASDIDHNASLSIANVTGLVDGLSLSGSTLQVNSSHAAFQSLNAGEQRVITVGYSVVDEHGASVQQTATISIQGRNEVLPGGAPAGTTALYGTNNAETLQGFDGSSELLVGYGGNDILRGLSGNDYLLGGTGADDLRGGDGNDVLIGGQGADTIRTGDGNDTIVFEFLSDAGDIITDLSPTDRIDLSQILRLPANMTGAAAMAAGYLQLVQAGANVTLRVDVDGSAGSSGWTTLATLQNERVAWISSGQFLVAGSAVDHSPEALDDYAQLNLAVSQSASGSVFAGAGADRDPDPGDVLAVSAVGPSHVPVGRAGTTVVGAYGTLTIRQDGSYSYLIGQSFLDAHNPEGTIVADTFEYMVSDSYGMSATAQLNVQVIASLHTSVFAGTTGGDELNGGGAADLIIGREGNDTLAGGGGNDVLLGGADQDMLSGNTGNDTLVGGAGNDVLYGGDGADTFYFAFNHGADVVDRLRSDDVLVFSSSLYQSAQEVRSAIQVTSGSQLRLNTPDGGSIQFSGTTLSDFQRATIIVQDVMFG